ncbi:MAG: sulfatase [Verrucomicrobiota bacterium]
MLQTLFAASCLWLLTSSCLLGQATPPNIVMIISDDQSWTDYGFMGHDAIQTPHLDKLAAQSATYTRGYVPTALCRPSLVTLVTGLYTHQHKISGNDPAPTLADPTKQKAKYDQLRAQLIGHIDKQPTVPQILGKKGYLSHQSGKWWEGNFSRGGFTHGMTRGFPQPGGRHGDDGLKIGREGMLPVFNFITEATMEKKPFFVWYAPFLPHTPHNPPQHLLDKYTQPGRSEYIAKYYAMCDWFDDTCGQLVNFLDEKGLRKNTLIVYVTDNGWIQSENSRKYAPRSKQSPNEGGTRTPIMFSWPGTIKPGLRSDLCSSIDIVPTMLSAAGANIPGNLPGLDLMPVLKTGGKIERDTIYGEGFAHDVANLEKPEDSLLYRWAIEGKWKLLLTYDGKVGRYASSHPRSERRPHLYDVLSDPDETVNVASQYPKVVAGLAKKIENWWTVKERKAITEWKD